MGELVYGVFPGGDPRKFTPDPDSSTEQERQRHREDCDKWERGELNQQPAQCCLLGDGSIWTGKGYGLGVMEYEDDDND